MYMKKIYAAPYTLPVIVSPAQYSRGHVVISVYPSVTPRLADHPSVLRKQFVPAATINMLLAPIDILLASILNCFCTCLKGLFVGSPIQSECD